MSDKIKQNATLIITVLLSAFTSINTFLPHSPGGSNLTHEEVWAHVALIALIGALTAAQKAINKFAPTSVTRTASVRVNDDGSFVVDSGANYALTHEDALKLRDHLNRKYPDAEPATKKTTRTRT